MARQSHYAPHEFDEDGFLKDPAHWNEEVAREIARHDGIAQLTDDHWSVIRTLREHYFAHGTLAPMRHVFHVNHLDEGSYNSLFGHSSREAWRIAGLPNPGEEAKTYMD